MIPTLDLNLNLDLDLKDELRINCISVPVSRGAISFAPAFRLIYRSTLIYGSTDLSVARKSRYIRLGII